MKELNNKGYAITIIVFGILIVFVTVLSTLLITMNNSVKLNKTVKEDVIENVELNANTTGMSLTERIEQIERKLSNIDENSNVIDTIYPVGSIYISAEDDTVEKVKERFGGEWESYAQGRTLVGIGTTTDENGNVLTYNSNQTGGSSLIQLSTSNLPSHSHSIPSLSGAAASTGSGYTLNYTYATRTTSSTAHAHTINVFGFEGETGSSELYGVSWGKYGARTINTESSGAHTHTVSDYYLSSLSGVAPHTHSVTTTASNTGASGSGTSFSVQDPYVTVYMYKRIK